MVWISIPVGMFFDNLFKSKTIQASSWKMERDVLKFDIIKVPSYTRNWI